jgi:hypothetical protein
MRTAVGFGNVKERIFGRMWRGLVIRLFLVGVFLAVGMKTTDPANQSGVGIPAGSGALDSCALHGSCLHDELRESLTTGLTLGEDLASSTTSPARFVGRDAVSASVDLGKLAQLLLLESDPLTVIDTSRNDVVAIDRDQIYTTKKLQELKTGVVEYTSLWQAILWTATGQVGCGR